MGCWSSYFVLIQTRLQSIYPECISSQKSDGTLKLEIPIEFGTPRSVNVKGSGPNALQMNLHDELLSLAVLPPILLEILLPPSYPLYLPPKIVSIRATNNWLVNILALQTALSQKWESGESVLYPWVEYVRTGDFFADIDLRSSDDVTFQYVHLPFISRLRKTPLIYRLAGFLIPLHNCFPPRFWNSTLLPKLLNSPKILTHAPFV